MNGIAGTKSVNDYLIANYGPGVRPRKIVARFGHRRRREETGTVQCQACFVRLKSLPSHLSHAHGLNAAEYRERYGANLLVVDPDMAADIAAKCAATKNRKREKDFRLCAAGCGTQLIRKKRGVWARFCSPTCAGSQRRRGVAPTCALCFKSLPYRPPSVVGGTSGSYHAACWNKVSGQKRLKRVQWTCLGCGLTEWRQPNKKAKRCPPCNRKWQREQYSGYPRGSWTK